MPEEAALRAELEQVRDAMLRDVAADHLDGRELLGCAVGGATLFLSLLFTAMAVFPVGDPTVGATVLLLVLALLCWGATAWLLRPYVRRRTADVREFRRLRRREKALLAQLPPGTTGRSTPVEYASRFFGGLPVLGLWLLGLLLVGLVLVAA